MTAIMLWVLMLLFALRVLGQVVVMVWTPGWLPSAAYWYSGLIPYGLLLPVQVGILLVQFIVARQCAIAQGFMIRHRPRLGFALVGLAWIYAGGMTLRLVLAIGNSATWAHHLIPVTFHVVLALFLGLWAKQLRHPGAGSHRFDDDAGAGEFGDADFGAGVDEAAFGDDVDLGVVPGEAGAAGGVEAGGDSAGVADVQRAPA